MLPRVIGPRRATVGWRRRFIGVPLLLSDVDEIRSGRRLCINRRESDVQGGALVGGVGWRGWSVRVVPRI